MSEQSERELRAVREAKFHLRQIVENVDKRQYWNALCGAQKLLRELMVAFDAVLKGE